MTDIETARRVLALSVDDDGLSAEDLRVLQAEESLTDKQASSLSNALADRFVSPEERAHLADPRLFPRPFVTALAGRDGMEPLRRRVDHLLARACDERFDFSGRSAALTELRTIFEGGEATSHRENFLRAAAPRILDVMTSLFRNGRDTELRRNALGVLTAMARPGSPSYLTRRQTLRAIELVGEAASDPDRGIRSQAFLAANYFYVSWPHDLPEGAVEPLEAWKRSCRPALEGILTAGCEDPDPNVRTFAREILETILIPRD